MEYKYLPKSKTKGIDNYCHTSIIIKSGINKEIIEMEI